MIRMSPCQIIAYMAFVSLCYTEHSLQKQDENSGVTESVNHALLTDMQVRCRCRPISDRLFTELLL